VLKSLSIKNYALIDSLNINFFSELNILTGETGAGKSILLGAIGLLIGQRAETNVLRDKNEKEFSTSKITTFSVFLPRMNLITTTSLFYDAKLHRKENHVHSSTIHQ
jgi:DNA repair ATPase RecN